MDLQQALVAQNFGVMDLTAAINDVEMAPSRIAEMGIFEEKGIRGLTVKVEYKNGKVIIVQSSVRGSDGQKKEGRSGKMFTFEAVHLLLNGDVWADDIIGIRAFGTDNDLQQLQGLIDEQQEDHRISLDATIEYHRISAMQGKVLDADGAVLVDLFSIYGLNPDVNLHTIDFTAPLKSQFVKVKTASKKAQVGVKAKKYSAFASESFWGFLIDNGDFDKAFERQSDGAALREDVSEGIMWQGILWELNVDEVDGKKMIPEGEAMVFPTDKKGLFLTRFAAAPYNETAGTLGLPFYANSDPKKMNKGVDLESQTNPINICTSPLAVRRLKIKPAA